MANKSAVRNCGCCGSITPNTIWYKLNCNDLKLTSIDNSVSITNLDSCAYDFSVSLLDTGVVAGSYTNSNITVDSKGRITSISDGSSGGGANDRFGVSGEDSFATQNRFFDLGSSHIMAISGSGTSFIVNQILGIASAIASIAITNGSVQTQVVDSTATQISSISLDPTGIQFGSTSGKYFFSNIPEYTDNAAAISGGLIPGGMYRTGDILKIAHS